MYPLTVGMLIQSRSIAEEVEGVLLELPVRNVIDENELGDWETLLERIEALRPEVFLLEASGLSDAGEAIQRIRQSAARPQVFVIDDKLRPERVLEVMRAGASEYLYPPFGRPLVEALERASEEVSRSSGPAKDDSSKVVGVFSSKGGSGGTTVSCHLAAELALQTKEKTLLVDLDLRGGLVGFLMRAKGERTLLDLTQNLYRLDHSYWKGVVSNGQPGLSVIRAPSAASGAAPTADQLRHVLTFSRSLYPWTVVDLGSGLSPLTVQLMDAIDELFMVTTLEITALHRAKQIAAELLRAGVSKDRFRVVLNRAPRNPDLTNEELQKMLGVPIYKSIPNDYPTLYEAYSDRTLAPEKTRIRQQFRRFAAKLAGVEAPKKRFSLFG